MADLQSSRIPDPLITCVLPEYEDKHIWWLILQYLQDTGFKHTASAFTLELNYKGVNGDDLKALSKDDLRKHISCLLTRQLVGSSASAAVLPRSAVAAAQGPALEAGKHSRLAAQKTAQVQDGKHQAAAGTARTRKGGSLSPMDIDHRHPQRLDQTEHERRHSSQQLQRKQQQQEAAKLSPKAAQAGGKRHKQEQAASDHNPAAHAAADKPEPQLEQPQQQQESKPAEAGIAAAAAAAPAQSDDAAPSASAAAAAAADSVPAAADNNTDTEAAAPAAVEDAAPASAAAAPAVAPILVNRLTSVTGEGEDTLDFGDGEDEEAAPAADMELGGSEDGELDLQEHRQDEQDEGARDNQQEQPAASEQHQQQQQLSVRRAPGSEARPQLKRGKVPIPTPPAQPSHSAAKSCSHSRSRSRDRSISHDKHRSRSRGSRSSRSTSRSRSGDRHRGRAHSRSRSRSRSPRSSRSRSRGRSRSRSYDSRSRSRSRGHGNDKRTSRSRSRDRRRTRSRSNSREGGREYQRGGGYQPRWQPNRQGGNFDRSAVRGGYNQSTYNNYGRGGGRGGAFVNSRYDGQDRRAGSDYGGGSYNSTYQARGRGRGRFTTFDNGRGGGRAGYQPGPRRPIYSNVHNTPHREGDENDAGNSAPHRHHHYEGGSDDMGDVQQLQQGAGSGGRPPEHHGSPAADGAAAAGGSAVERDDAAAAAAGVHRPRSSQEEEGRRDGSSRYGSRGRGGRAGWVGPGRPLPPPPPSKEIDDHRSSSPGRGDADNAAEAADAAAGGPKAVGKHGGKFDWPPRDAAGRIITSATAAAAPNHDRPAGRLGARRHSMPEPDRGHRGGRGPRERFVQPGRRSLTLRSGLVVADIPDDAAAGDAGDGMNDRWRGDEHERGSRSQSRSPRHWDDGGRWDEGHGAEHRGRDASRCDAEHQQHERQARRSSDGSGAATVVSREGRDSSPGHAADGGDAAAASAAAAAAVAGLSGAHVLAKRRLSATEGAMITDLSGASHDSPVRGAASPASTAADGGGPTKKARASSPP